jgi:alkanesulfonate monooxygenase
MPARGNSMTSSLGSGIPSPTTPSCDDVESGLFVDPAKMHTLNHKRQLSLKVKRPAERRPPGAGLAGDRAGRRLGGRASARGRNRRSHFRRISQHRRRPRILCRRQGSPPISWARNRDQLKILPGAFVDRRRQTRSEAREEARGARQTRCTTTSGLASLSIALRTSTRPASIPTAPLPELPESNASQSSQRPAWWTAARRGNRDRAPARSASLGGYSGLQFLGTPKGIADQMEEWLVTRGLRWLQRDVPLLAGRARRFRRQG